jgi:sulfite reductase (NADPH) flavoprotein alpha-component
MTLQLVPESAPFSIDQRAWLNGFFAGVLGVLDEQQARGGSPVSLAAAASMLAPPPGSEPVNVAAAEEDYPWHDSSLTIDDRMKLADGRPKPRRLMAAMAQLNCGSCGYLCKTYAEAISSGSEKNLTLCSPGGSDTAKMLRKLVKEPDSAPATTTITEAKPAGAPGTRNNPVEATIISNAGLNKSGSAKDTRHIEIDLSKSGLKYNVGDALGILPMNCTELVAKCITAAKLDPKSSVTIDGKSLSLDEALTTRCLRSISPDFVEAIIGHIKNCDKVNGSVQTDATLVENLTAFLESSELDQWDVLEFLEHYPTMLLPAQLFAEGLAPVRPRLYSIASSQSKYADQVHLTVGRVEIEVRGRSRKGVASTMLADRVSCGTAVQVFIHPAHGFTVPKDANAPMIMVGPGTGIAPFMAFLQQREADKSPGKNWLFFGDQKRSCDYLYEGQLEDWKASGFLTRLDLAFSRDGNDKVYVQQRMKENGAELFAWLEQGGYFFVCGDAKRMAVDVDKALQEVIAEHGKLSAADAKKYLDKLSQDKRYVRDVY